MLLLVLAFAGAGLRHVFDARTRATLPEGAPSVLLITIDTLRADRLGAYGSTRGLTPNLDALAGRAAVFDNAFCNIPVTIPAHASMLFGTWPRLLGSTSNYRRVTNDSVAYLPKVLQDAGYRTAAFLSRDHLGSAFGRFQGFDALNFPSDEQTADVTLGAAQAWLDRYGDEPFFLWIHLWDPHAPYGLHPRFMDRLDPDPEEGFRHRHMWIPVDAYTPAQMDTMIDLYDNEVAYMDHQLGGFLSFVESRGIGRRTLLVVTADHGETLDELADSHGYAFDHGEFLHRSQVHVPLLVVPPTGIPSGRRIDAAVSHVDLMPTILDFLRQPIPESVDGRSLWPVIGGAKPPAESAPVFLQRTTYRKPPRPYLAFDQYAARSPQFVLMRDEEPPSLHLYRAGEETLEVGDREREERDRLAQALEDWVAYTEAGEAGAEDVSETEAERLRALGYVQ